MKAAALILLALGCGPVTQEDRPTLELSGAFGRIVADRVGLLLDAQQSDGSIAPFQAETALQAVQAFTFCYLGMDPDGRRKGDPRLRDAIRSLGRYLTASIDEKGVFEEGRPNPRVVYAWADSMIRLRAAVKAGEFDFALWSDRLERSCRLLIDMRLNHLRDVRRFVGRHMATGANHVAFYLTAVYRAGQALGRRDLIDFALPIARRFAADIHPDGYWEEHGDLLRTGGPTTSYNLLTTTCIALLGEWTGEAVFEEAVARSVRFHLNFTYPDGIPLDLIDERVRYKKEPHVRAWFAFSRLQEGRGASRLFLEHWLKLNPPGKLVAPDALSRLCENQLYWHRGNEATAPFARTDHRAALTLPAAFYRKADWAIGLSAMRATQAEDPAYRDSVFALDREKLLSVFHSRAGLILDGSHSKGHPMNATFAVTAHNWKREPKAVDYLPVGGTVGEVDGVFEAKADYRSFRGTARVRVRSADALEIVLEADLQATRGPAVAGFTFLPKGESLRAGTEVREFGTTSWELAAAKISYGPVTIEGPEGLTVQWPFSPFNSYSPDHRSPPEANLGRVSVQLTPERPRAAFVLTVR